MTVTDPAIAEFFNGWELYRAVIDGDLMEHRAVRAAIAPVLRERVAPFKVLDLGCGDAALLAPLLADAPIAGYTGVDVAAQALEYARTELAPLGERVELRAEDLMAFLHTTDERFDVILISFALHHLDSADKQLFLRRAAGRLNPGGDLVLVDTVRRDGESRDDYLDRYESMVRTTWPLGEDLRQRVVTHIRRNDFPEEFATQPQWALDAGYAKVVELYRGARDTQAAWRLSVA